MDASFLQNVALIAGTVVVVGLGLAAIDFARREVKGRARSEEDLLAQFRGAYDAGEMDSGEFRRVSESLRRKSGGRAPAHPLPPVALDLPPADRPMEEARGPAEAEGGAASAPQPPPPPG